MGFFRISAEMSRLKRELLVVSACASVVAPAALMLLLLQSSRAILPLATSSASAGQPASPSSLKASIAVCAGSAEVASTSSARWARAVDGRAAVGGRAAGGACAGKGGVEFGDAAGEAAGAGAAGASFASTSAAMVGRFLFVVVILVHDRVNLL